MPCNDSSREENCPPSPHEEAEDACTCGCPPEAHMGRPSGCTKHGFHEYELRDEAPPPDPKAECPNSPDGSHCFEHDPGVCCHCDAVTPATEEEEPEGENCQHVGAEITGGQLTPERWGDYRCKDCGARWRRFWDRAGEPAEVLRQGKKPYKLTEAGERMMSLVQQRRPPYAVAYAVEGQEPYEVLVPGDAIVGIHEGQLTILHDTDVTKILQVKPWGEPDA